MSGQLVPVGAWSAGFLLLAAGVARAQEPPAELPRVRLEYVAPEACPDEGALRAAVAIRLGQDPFAADALRRVRVRIEAVPGVHRGTVEGYDAGGMPAGSRTVEARTDACGELLDALALALAIAVDPLVLVRAPVAACGPAPATRVVTRTVRVRELIRPAAASSPVVPRVRAGVEGVIGAAPAATVGARVGAEVRWRRLAIGIEARLDATTSVRFADGTGADLGMVLITASPCWIVPVAARWRGRACALLSAGALRGEGVGVDRPRRATVPYLAAGARVGIDLGLVGPMGLEAHLDVETPLPRTGFVLDGRTIWTTPRLALAAGIAAAVEFP